MPKQPTPADVFTRESVLDGVYRGDFYSVVVGHRYDAYTGDFFVHPKHKPGDFAPFHFGKLVRWDDVSHTNENGNGVLEIENEDGAILHSYEIAKENKQFKKWKNVLEANLDRPILVVMLVQRGVKTGEDGTFFAVEHDPKAVTTAKNGSMKVVPDEKLVDPGTYQESLNIEWEEVEKWLGPTRTNELIGEGEQLFTDGKADENGLIALHERIQEELHVAVMKNAGQLYLPSTKRLTALVRKRGMDRSEFNWIETGRILDTQYKVFSQTAKAMSLPAGQFTITVERLKHKYVFDSEQSTLSIEEIDEAVERIKANDEPAAICVGTTRGRKTFVDIVGLLSEPMSKQEQKAAVIDNQYQNIVGARRHGKRQIADKQSHLKEQERDARETHKANMLAIQEQMRPLQEQLKHTEDRLKDQLGPIHQMQQKLKEELKAINAVDIKEVNLETARLHEALKLANLQAFMRDAQRSANSAKSLFERVNQIDGPELASAFSKASSAFDVVKNRDKIRIPLKVQEATAKAKMSFNASASGEVVKAETGGNDLERDNLMLRLQLAEQANQKNQIEMALMRLTQQQQEWKSRSEEDIKQYKLQLAKYDEAEQAEADRNQTDKSSRAATFARWKKMVDHLDGQEGTLFVMRLPSRHSRETLCLRGGYDHDGKTIEVKILEFTGEDNNFRVFLPKYDIEIIACIDFDNHAPGQMVVLTWKSTALNWWDHEQEVTGMSGKYKAGLPFSQYIAWHEETRVRVMNAKIIAAQ